MRIQAKLLRLLKDEEVLSTVKKVSPAELLFEVFSRKEAEIFTGGWKVIFTPIDIASSSVLLFLLLGLVAALLSRKQRLLIDICFSLAAIASLLGFIAGAWTVAGGVTEKIVLLVGLPDLPFHLRLDPLSGFFLTVIGLLSFFVSIYSIGYVRGFLGKRSVTSLVVFYCLFIAGMFMVVMADDALFFLISWEIMAAASYFLVLV